MRSDGSVALAPLWDAVRPSERLASSACELPAAYESVREARHFTCTTLRRWGLCELVDNVALVASELVTNALRHGVGTDTGPHPTAAQTSPPPVVRLGLARWTSRVVVSVRDPNSQGPVPRTPDFVAESGRGLHLVASCCETWGWHPLMGAGKVVWALFPAPSN
jgi:anti-sigma regulatory factor (Ser/Thr protein kinase)